jgi:hypothetical protein
MNKKDSGIPLAKKRPILCGMFVMIVLCGFGANSEDPKVSFDLPARNIAERIVSGQMSDTFEASMEVMEATDFLLTPALLVQEALMEDVVPTYLAE